MLLPRFLTALLGAPLLIAAIWWGQFPFFILMSGIIMLSLYEYYTLAEEAQWPVSKKTGLAAGALLVVSMVLFGTRFGWGAGVSGVGFLAAKEGFFLPMLISVLLMLLLGASSLGRRKENAFVDFALTWLGLFYVVWTLSHLLLIRDLRPDGEFYTFFLFAVVWTLDIGAYFGGLRFGRTKLSESVSPKKTWEGALIGSGSAILVALICRATFLRSMRVHQALVLAVIVVVLAQLSDLSESLFKRNVQVKDSGTVLPGHGGILDRFDSFLLTTPVYYYCVILFVLK